MALIIAMSLGFNAVLIVGASTYIALYIIGNRHEVRLQQALARKLENASISKGKQIWQNGKALNKPRL
jgi:coenzyme F420-reducing hydrogenase delta subunit